MQAPPFIQGLGSQLSNGVSQVGPVKVTEHRQENPPGRSVHSPPFRHGLSAHSSLFLSKNVLEEPAWQSHAERSPLTVPPFMHARVHTSAKYTHYRL